MKQIILAFLIALPLQAATIPVGPSRAVKDLSKVADGNEYVLDWASTPYKWPYNLTVKGTFIIRSANPTARATVQFPSQWGQLPTGVPDEGSPKGFSITCYGSCTMKDLKTSGGEGVIIFTTKPGATLLAQHIDMDGGGILRGSGAKTISIINVQSSGRPTAYFIANFDNAADSLLVDLSANTMPVRQGGHAGSGKPTCTNTGSDWCQGEAAVRIMDVNNGKLIGLTFVPWLFDGKTAWKQLLQIRHSNTIEVANSTVQSLDIGNMTWENITAIEKCGGPLGPMTELKKLILTDDTIGSTLTHAGVREVVTQKTVNGKVTVTSDKKYSYTCPAPTGRCPFKEKDTPGCKLVTQ